MRTNAAVGTNGGVIQAEHLLGETDVEILIWAADSDTLKLDPKVALRFAEQLASVAKRALDWGKKK